NSMRALRKTIVIVLLARALTGVAGAFGADEKSAANPAQPFFTQHCQGCHAGDKPKGKFRLDSLSQDFVDESNRKRWLMVLEQIKEGTMPPAEKPQPSAKEVETVA